MTTMQLQGNERLLAARVEIEEVLKRHDIAGHIVLCCPGFVEVMAHLEATWSRVQRIQVDGYEGMRVHSNLQKDYGGDKAAQRRDLEATIGMLQCMADTLGPQALNMLELLRMIATQVPHASTPLMPVQRDEGPMQ